MNCWKKIKKINFKTCVALSMSVKNTLFKSFCFIVTMLSLSFGQSLISQIEDLYQQDRLQDVIELFPAAADQYPNHPTVLYLQGVFSKDAQEAIEYFERIVKNHPLSNAMDKALFKLGQYYYAQDAYKKAFEYFSTLNQQFPSSHLRDVAQYMTCQCLLAQGKTDSAQIFFETFIRNAPRSFYADLAIMDLEMQDRWQEQFNRTRDNNLPPSKFLYSIQVGAFSDPLNAEKMKKAFEKRRYDVDVVKLHRPQGLLYAVWVGRFETRSLANNFVEKHKQSLGQEFSVVERNK